MRRVLDLRTDLEVKKSGAPSLPVGCEWTRLPLFESVPAHWAGQISRTPVSTAERYFEMLQIGRPILAQIVDILDDVESNPTLIHCVAGRDRTGIVIACLLDLLDVPDQVIAADYSLSSVMDDQEGRNASPDNIALLLGLIRGQFGSTREMLLGSGSSADSIERLQSALLE